MSSTQVNEQRPTFVYLGRTFQAYSTQDGSKWIAGSTHMMRLTMGGYDHTAFYQAAARVGADRYNVFVLDGWLMMPCASDLLVFK